jgi:hypothetical protein
MFTKRRSRRKPAAVRLLPVALVVAAIGGGILLFTPREAPPPAVDPAPKPSIRVRVEVLNGAGVQGLAQAATRRLRDAGYDVVYFGNADRFDHEHSMVVLRDGPMESARAVAATLAIDSLLASPDTTRLLEKDWGG